MLTRLSATSHHKAIATPMKPANPAKASSPDRPVGAAAPSLVPVLLLVEVAPPPATVVPSITTTPVVAPGVYQGPPLVEEAPTFNHDVQSPDRFTLPVGVKYWLYPLPPQAAVHTQITAFPRLSMQFIPSKLYFSAQSLPLHVQFPSSSHETPLTSQRARCRSSGIGAFGMPVTVDACCEDTMGTMDVVLGDFNWDLV